MNEQYTNLLEEDEKPVDYKALVFEYLIHWPYILAFLILSLAGCYVYLRYQAPVYNVNATVLIKQDDKKSAVNSPLGTIQDFGMLSMASNFDNEMEILQSRTLLKKVVNQLNLYINYSQKNSFGYATSLYKNTPVQVWMAPEEADRLQAPMQLEIGYTPNGQTAVTATYTQNGAEDKVSKSFDKLPAVLVTPVGTLSLTLATDSTLQQQPLTYQATVTSPTGTAAGCRAKLSAAPTSNSTTIVRLNYNDGNIRRGQDFLNTLVALYNSDANDDKNEVASRTADFINSRIDIINRELGTTEQELADYKQQAGLTDLSTDASMALQSSSQYDQKRAENTTQIRLVEFLRQYIETPANQYEVIPANIGLSDNGLITLIAQYNEMLIERKRLLRTSNENNPVVINLDISIAATRNSVLSSVASVEKGLQITRNNLNAEARKYETRISNAPKQEKELISISRQQEIKANLYLMLLQKREENAITLAATANNGRIIEEPMFGGQVAPNGKQFYLIALVLGLAIPVGGIFLIRLLRYKIEGRADVEHITDITIIGDIPQIEHNEHEGIVVRENENGLMEEIYRSVRTNLQYMLRDGQKVILFTSTTSGEGKSFNAGNLAVSFAFMGKKTLIVGMDIRKPGLNKIFDISRKGEGITRYLAHPEETDILSLCQPSSLSPNLYILPGGVVPPNPTELVARESLDQALAVLREHFDYIILDTAPIGIVTDTQLIARVADVSVYVCRADYTHKSDFAYINELKRENKLPNLCTLINGINMNKRRNGYYYGYGKYGKYGKYGYGKKYGYGYGYGYGKD